MKIHHWTIDHFQGKLTGLTQGAKAKRNAIIDQNHPLTIVVMWDSPCLPSVTIDFNPQWWVALYNTIGLPVPKNAIA
jgi:hypothetical protein